MNELAIVSKPYREAYERASERHKELAKAAAAIPSWRFLKKAEAEVAADNAMWEAIRLGRWLERATGGLYAS